jgi:hypothetical protein
VKAAVWWPFLFGSSTDLSFPFAAAEGEWIKDEQQGELFEALVFKGRVFALPAFIFSTEGKKLWGHVSSTCPHNLSRHWVCFFAYFLLHKQRK